MDLALNNLQSLICHKTQPTKLFTYKSYINKKGFNCEETNELKQLV